MLALQLYFHILLSQRVPTVEVKVWWVLGWVCVTATTLSPGTGGADGTVMFTAAVYIQKLHELIFGDLCLIQTP